MNKDDVFSVIKNLKADTALATAVKFAAYDILAAVKQDEFGYWSTGDIKREFLDGFNSIEEMVRDKNFALTNYDIAESVLSEEEFDKYRDGYYECDVVGESTLSQYYKKDWLSIEEFVINKAFMLIRFALRWECLNETEVIAVKGE